MAGFDNRVDALIANVVGLGLRPTTFEGDLRLQGDLEARLSWLVGLTDTGSIALKATTAGSLKVADTGSGLETIEPFSGTATDTATALGVGQQSSRVSLEISDYSLDVAFQKASGSWSGDLVLKPGFWEWDFSFKDIRINNTVGGSDSVYQIFCWS